MVRQQLPSAAEVWEQIPLPALAQNVKTQGAAGLHVFRLCKGLDITGNELYVVECRDILGMATAFTQKFSGVFDDLKKAYNFYNLGKYEAKKEYARLAKQYKERGGIYE